MSIDKGVGDFVMGKAGVFAQPQKWQLSGD